MSDKQAWIDKHMQAARELSHKSANGVLPNMIREALHDFDGHGTRAEREHRHEMAELALDALLVEIEKLREGLRWISANDEHGWFGGRARSVLAGDEVA